MLMLVGRHDWGDPERDERKPGPVTSPWVRRATRGELPVGPVRPRGRTLGRILRDTLPPMAQEAPED